MAMMRRERERGMRGRKECKSPTQSHIVYQPCTCPASNLFNKPVFLLQSIMGDHLFVNLFLIVLNVELCIHFRLERALYTDVM